MAKPRTLVLTLLGRHVFGHPMAVATSTFLEILERLNVSEHAARSTLSRMADRGFLDRHQRGRRAFYSLTDYTAELLSEGTPRIFEVSPVTTDEDPFWTFLAFSIPEGQRSNRHKLRVNLSWEGFGPLRNGLWMAPGAVDVTVMLDRIGVRDHVEAFVGRPVSPSSVEEVISEVWDLDHMRDQYRRFIRRWDDTQPSTAAGALAAEILLITEWRLLVLQNPRLPVAHLPEGWPAQDAYEVFLSRHEDLRSEAEQEFEALLDAIELDKDG